MSTRDVENDKFLLMVGRMVKAAGRRVAAGDIESLGKLMDLQRSLDDTIGIAARALHDEGYSWTEIADRLGVSREAPRKRWGAAS